MASTCHTLKMIRWSQLVDQGHTVVVRGKSDLHFTFHPFPSAYHLAAGTPSCNPVVFLSFETIISLVKLPLALVITGTRQTAFVHDHSHQKNTSCEHVSRSIHGAGAT